MTVRQIQHLLGFLGYYTLTVDGIWGPESIRATSAFQEDYGLAPDGAAGEKTQSALRAAVAEGWQKQQEAEDFWTDISCFRREEFRCTCAGRGCGGFPAEPSEQLVRNAEAARKHFGSPADVSSGVRCPLRNSELPGSAANSLHLRGRAMDFRVRGVDSGALLAFVRTLPGVDEAYAIDEHFVHMGVEKYR